MSEKTLRRMVAEMRKCLEEPNQDPCQVIDAIRDISNETEVRRKARRELYKCRSFIKLVADFDTGWPGGGATLYEYALAWRRGVVK